MHNILKLYTRLNEEDPEVDRLVSFPFFLCKVGKKWKLLVTTWTQSSVITSVADPDPGSGVFLTHGFGMGKKSRSESESLKTIFLG